MISVLALFAFVVFPLFILPWLRAFMTDADVPLTQIIGMRLRGNPPVLLIDAYIVLKRQNVSATIVDVEEVYIDSRTRVSSSSDLVELVKRSVNGE